MTVKRTIVILRHVNTEWNDPDHIRFTGLIDVDISEKGIKQALKLKKMLKDYHFDYGYSSHLKRSMKTIKTILKEYHKNTKIIIDDRIIERNYGDLNGKYYKVIIKKFGKKQFEIWKRSYDTPPPNGESIKMVEKRTYPFCFEIINKIKKEKVNIIMVGHDNSMKAIRSYFENLNVKQENSIKNPQGDYIEYEVDCETGKVKAIRNGVKK